MHNAQSYSPLLRFQYLSVSTLYILLHFSTTHHKYGVDILTLETTQEKRFFVFIVVLLSLLPLSDLPSGFPSGIPCCGSFGKKHLRKRFRAISTARLYVTIVHLQPIYVVVYNDPQWKSNLGASFALRCFQRLSEPNAATRLCPWRNNRCTGGSSNTVLSY